FIKDVTIVKPIIYGSTATFFGKKREEDNRTHSWSLYVRPYYKEDMSLYVRKVVFKLHESYTNPTRSKLILIVLEPPYEIHETGWGEFEAVIKIFFHDTNERHVNIYHIIRLFDTDPLVMSGQKSLVREMYDEIVS
ncbi:unnamed protein product, partial [Soboliphyme baturini]|uniref:YEATS domain-containing protein 4 n=1 Tax=Soboliphyme baturini TaxID=241478 RepID=A0A183IWZ9_9BILA